MVSAPWRAGLAIPAVDVAGRGLSSGFLGAFVIALFFFVVDWIEGRLLWTPAALGSALFLGERLAPDADAPLALVAGYTGIHFLVFAGIGLITAALLSEPPEARPRRDARHRIGLFAACELTSSSASRCSLSPACSATWAFRASRPRTRSRPSP
jgi:hypothetical protein